MNASESGHFDIFRLLVQRGADIEATDYLGRTIVHRAAISGNFNIVKFLIEKKVGINHEDDNGHEP